MMSLNSYLLKAACGDSKSAFEAAKIMECNKYHDVLVQAQLRKAAALGSIDAMRWLGFLGLFGKLIHPDSNISDTFYYQGYEEAYQWFCNASDCGDCFSSYVVGMCLYYGIGTCKDENKATQIFSNTHYSLPENSIFSISFILAITSCQITNTSQIVNIESVKKLIAS